MTVRGLLLILAGVFGGLHDALAQSEWYHVEVIVFEHLRADPDGEVWTVNPGLPATGNSIDLFAAEPPASGRRAFTALPSGRLKLAGTYRAIRNSSEYRPILHAAWEQPGLGPARAQSVLLRSAGNGGLTADLGALQVLGSVKLRKTRFLHVDVDLAYFLRRLPPGSAPQAGDYVRLSESRKLKLNELHYFDHPLFGAIVQVTRAGG
jgi:hypothetical protein